MIPTTADNGLQAVVPLAANRRRVAEPASETDGAASTKASRCEVYFKVSA
jgi:hypothetical protein